MKSLFDKTKLKNIELKNRFIRSATHEGMAGKDGAVNERLINIYENIAKGGVSTIISGFAYVVAGDPCSPGMIGAYDDRFIGGLKALTDAVHKHGANIILQVAEGGPQAKFNLKTRTVYAPSVVEHKHTGVIPVEMTKEDIKKHVEAFGNAALRAKKSGFDGIQMHAAHGYLLSQFLTPYYNRRNDEYGGNIENRLRIIMEVYENMRQKAGDDYVVAIKINCSDFMGDDGLTFEESRYVCKKLDEKGIDLIEISGNVGFNPAEPEIIRTDIHNDLSKQCYYSEYAKVVAKETRCPVAVVGGNRDFALMNEILNCTDIEYFSLSRAILREPDLVNKWEQDNSYESGCMSCNKCFSLKGNVCIFNR